MGEKNNMLFRRIFNYPFFYSSFQRFIGKSNGGVFLNKYLGDVSGKRILDLGCGTADVLKIIKNEELYVGIDYNKRYITAARKKYNDRKSCSFYHTDLTTFSKMNKQKFDIVLMMGVMHHISDEDIRVSLKAVQKVLADGGEFLSYDCCFTKHMNPIARMLCYLDRGKYVRMADEYIRLQNELWNSVLYEVRTDTLRFLPYSVIFFRNQQIYNK